MKAIHRSYLFLSLFAISMMLFVSSCDDDDELEIQYPETGFYGDNILMKGKTDYTTEQSSFQAKLPEGQKVKIIITGNAAFPDAIWGSRSIHNWAIYGMGTAYTQIFQSIDGGQTCVLEIQFNVGTYQIDYYENDATSPTYSKTIVVN
ncbi:MAG TPA: hypothetical protein VFG46_22330 [Chryseolinea sp.]|nr:hypothetical protein [Chryseolinea sp.]